MLLLISPLPSPVHVWYRPRSLAPVGGVGCQLVPSTGGCCLPSTGQRVAAARRAAVTGKLLDVRCCCRWSRRCWREPSPSACFAAVVGWLVVVVHAGAATAAGLLSPALLMLPSPVTGSVIGGALHCFMVLCFNCYQSAFVAVHCLQLALLALLSPVLLMFRCCRRSQ